MTKNKMIVVKESPINIIEVNRQDYISLTDMVKSFGDEIIIHNWLRNRNTIEFLGIWETIYNPDFKPLAFEGFKKQAGLNSFSLSPKKWTEAPMLLALCLKPGGMAAVLLHIRTLPLSSGRGSALNLNSIL